MTGNGLLHHAYTVRTAFTFSRQPYTQELTELRKYEGEEFQRRTNFMEKPTNTDNVLIYETALYRTPARVEAYCTNSKEYEATLAEEKRKELEARVTDVIKRLGLTAPGTESEKLTDERIKELEPLTR